MARFGHKKTSSSTLDEKVFGDGLTAAHLSSLLTSQDEH